VSKRKLLLADDSVTIQKVVNLTFADEGIEVVTAGDGNAAIDHINAGLPDIILADINMPGTNGYQLCEMIRANEQTASIPVILLVGSFEPFDANEAARVGASSVLTKPFSSIRALVDKVFELLDASVSADENIHETYAQPDAVAEPAVQTEPDDIEDLYHQSLSGGEADDEQETIEFVDAGMDDEMVETEHLQNEDTLADYPIDQNEAEVEETPVAITENYEPAEHREVQTQEVEQPATQNFGEVTQEFETFEEFKNVDDDEDAEIAEFNSTINSYRQNFEMRPENEEPISSAVSEYPETTPYEETLSYDEPEYQDETVEQVEQIPQNEIETASESEPAAAEEEIAEPNAFEFEEIELLQLPRINDDSRLDLVTSAEAIARNSMQRAVSLSPDLIDMIVERVVERLRREG
jgi:CheY-like chemotaxis protein